MLTGGWQPRKRVDFCLAITQGAWVAVCEEGIVALPRPLAVGRRGAVALALGAGALLAVRLDVPAFFDNEARYAEVAREMVLSGDWISPHLDFTLFLNKPPLVFWLAALVFRLAGPTEWARLVSVGAAMVALLATCRLGALLYGGTTGLVAGLALATSLGFVRAPRALARRPLRRPRGRRARQGPRAARARRPSDRRGHAPRRRLARRRAPPARARAARAGRDRRPLARRGRAPAPRLRVGLRREPARALLLRQEAAARLGGRLARVLLGGRRGPRRAVGAARAAHARRGGARRRPAGRAGGAGHVPPLGVGGRAAPLLLVRALPAR